MHDLMPCVLFDFAHVSYMHVTQVYAILVVGDLYCSLVNVLFYEKGNIL